MSKRALRKYLSEMSEEALQEQLLDLYERFPQVKTYYDFVFNPREDQLVQEAQTRILKEYFPSGRRRPKARRSVAQKYIKHFSTLGMDPYLLAELMAFNLETAFRFEQSRRCPEAFYKSMLNSSREWLVHLAEYGLISEFRDRAAAYLEGVSQAGWPNAYAFEGLLENLKP